MAFAVIGAFVMLIFVGRLFNIQIQQGPAYLDEAVENRISNINLPASRGNIYDRYGIILARNVPAFNIVITPANLPEDEGEIQEIFRALSELTGVPINRGEISPENPFSPCISDHGIAQVVEYGDTTAPFGQVPIQCDVDETIAMIVQERAVDWPGVSVQVESVRDYPTGALSAAVVGFLGPIPAALEEEYVAEGFVPQRDKVGYAGVEFTFQDWLGGENGLRVVERDVAGQVLRDVVPPTDPVPGYNVSLSLDMRLQEATDAIVKQELNFWNQYLNRTLSNNAVAIAMNPKTGEILAMVSYPTYENNRFARVISAYYYEQLAADPIRPLFNHAISAEHPPGSVFKLSTAVGALNEGVVTPEQVIDTPGEITLTEKFYANDPGNAREFVDWNRAGFGQLDFLGGLANSSNVYFYKLGGGYRDEVPGTGLGVCRLGAYARALGYGDFTGIELPGDADGLIPTPRWKRIQRGENWSTGDTYIAAVGQGFVLATPLQVLLSAQTIANDGKLLNPTVIHEVSDGEGNIIRQLVDDQGNVIQPGVPDVRWDLTLDPIIADYTQYVSGSGGCQETGVTKTVEPWVIEKVQEGMRLAVTQGTLAEEFDGFTIAAAGKTGTAEYCDNFAQAQNRCIPGNWPSHAWTVAYAPYENPEIVVVAFVYNGGEGASVAGPIVRKVLQAYFELKAVDTAPEAP